jgi:serine/threonine protein kinase
VHAVYKKLVLVVHPDRFQGLYQRMDLPVAHEAMQRLAMLKSDADRKIAAGTYGDRKAAPPAARKGPIAISVRGRTHMVGELLCHGDLCDLYHCEYDDGSGTKRPAVLKIVQHARDNDLADAERSSLSTIATATGSSLVDFAPYYPTVVDSFMLKGTSNRRVNIFAPLAEHVGADAVCAAYRSGIDFRDMAWMFRRTLSAIGLAHRRGIVHGAVLPQHLMLRLSNHGATLVDWCYSVPVGQSIKAISEVHRYWYPPEVLRKEPATAATDIYMAAKLALVLIGGDPQLPSVPGRVPDRIGSFLASCCISSPSRRPQDAWDLHEEFGELMQKLVGKPKFRHFQMPTETNK